MTMNIIVRNIAPDVLERIDAEARRRNLSRQEFLVKLLTDWVRPPVVIGWLRVDRNGELSLADGNDDPDDCIECGQPLDWPWLAVLSNGELYGPCCSVCATSR